MTKAITKVPTTPRFASTVLPQPRASTRVRDTLRATGGNGCGGGSPGLATDTYNYATPAPAVVNDGMGNYFESLRVSEDRTAIPYAMVHLRPQLLRLLNGLNRKMLAAVGRYLMDNCGVASYAVGLIANYSVPVTPHSQCQDKDAATLYEEYFKSWSARADFTKRYTFNDLQRIACMAIDSDGDMGATMTLKNNFPQLRMWDTFHIGKLTGLDPLDGVVPDSQGVLTGYKVVDGPLETLQSAADTFIPADQMILLRDATRYDLYRGYSPIRRGSNDLRDEQDIKAFTKIKEKIGAALAAVIQQNGMVEEDLWGNDSGRGGTSEAINHDPQKTPQEKKLSLAELLGGDIPVIEGEIKQLEHKSPGMDTVEFMNFLAGQFVAGLDIPPAYFLDEKLTGPNVRSVMNKVQKKFDNRKEIIARFVEWCWIRVIAFGIAEDGLPAVPGWEKISYQYQPLLTIDLGDVMNQERQDVACGQMSEKERFGNRGKDALVERAQINAEIDEKLASAIALQKKYPDVPLQLILAKMGFAPSISAPAPPAESGSDEPEKSKKKT